MYSLKYILCFVTLAYTYGKPSLPMLSKGYTYSANTNNYYKFHGKPADWNDAVATCRSEGAQLFYPVDEAEAREVHTLLNLWSYEKYVLRIGISDLRTNGVFETIDGRHLNEVHSKWDVDFGYPKYTESGFQCIGMWNEYELWNTGCDAKWKFVCKYIPGSNGDNLVDYTTITTPGQDETLEVSTEAIGITTSVNVDSIHSGGVTAPMEDGNTSVFAKEVVNDESRSHIHFGNLVGEELKRFTHREKIEIMVSILEVIQRAKAQSQCASEQ